jgi:Holliday junction resolvase
VNRFAKGHADANHRTIVDTFRRAGCSVLELTAVGFGAPDLLIGKHGRTFLVEVKDGAKSPSRRKLRPSQVAFAAAWRGGPVHVVKDVTEAWTLAQLLARPEGA